jgi:type IV pilus assembly protein PilM
LVQQIFETLWIMALPFLNSQSKRVDQIVAVDLGARQTKAVHLQNRNDRIALLGYAVMEAPNRDKPGSAEGLGNHLKSLLKAMGDGVRYAALGVDVPDAFLRHAELPPMPLPDMRQMLRLNSKAYLQQDYPDHVFDCSIILSRPAPSGAQTTKPAVATPGPQKQKVLVGGIKRQVLDDVKAACKIAGLVPLHVTPSMVGPVNAFEATEPEVFAKEVVALVDIGFRQTTISMLKYGELVMNRVVALGGDHLTKGLAEALGVSDAEAESIKIGMPGEVQQNLEPVIANLGRELRASLDFFEHQQDVAVGKVFLSGGTARSEFTVRALQTEIMVPCNTWNPTKKLLLSLPVQQRAGLEESAPQLVVALGVGALAF